MNLGTLPWYIAGPSITVIMVLLVWSGKTFGASANLRTLCSIGGAGKYSEFFRFDWKSQRWNLLVALGSIIGGFVAHQFIHNGKANISQETRSELSSLGLSEPGEQLVPIELYGQLIAKPQRLALLILGGLMIGFGTRYAGGCTSGHAIMGLSNLQWLSLVAVIGFFIGGLAMTYFGLPYILNWVA